MEEDEGGSGVGGPVTDARHKGGPDWFISTILGSALWLIKGGGSAERLQKLLCFCPPPPFLSLSFLVQMEARTALLQLRHKLIREREEVAGGRIVRSLRLLLY